MLAMTLAPEIAKNQAELRDGPDGLVLSLQEIGFYDPGSDVLKEASTNTLSRVAEALKTTKLRIRIEGHTDDVPIHNARFASNWELSSARATGLVRLFIERFQFDPARLAAAGYAEYHPIQSNLSPEGRSMNRRVDIVILAASRRPTALANEVKHKQPASEALPAAETASSKAVPSAGQ
jgi:chemotaxis protein MotB